MRLSPTVLAASLLAAPLLHAETFTVDATKNCVFLDRAEKPVDKAVKVPLSLATRYRVTISGEGFFSPETGTEADPMPGVVLFYPTNEQDGFATIYRVVRPGESLEFVTPKMDAPSVFLLAFVIDHWPQSANTGAYKLTVDKL